MKQFSCILLTLLTISVISCKKNKLPIPSWGKASVNRDGVFVHVYPSARENKPYNQGVDIQLYFLKKGNTLMGSLHFFKIPLSPGTYELIESSVRNIDSLSGANFTTLIGGDVIDDFYDLVEGDIDNFITLNNINGNEISGEFQAVFIKDHPDGNGLDTVRFTNGQFHTKILE